MAVGWREAQEGGDICIHIVEVRNRFKGLALIDRMMDRGLCHCTGDRNQDHPQEKEIQKSKMVV